MAYFPQLPYQEKFTLVTKESHVRGTNVEYKFDDETGLNDRELPPDKDFIVLKVQALCYSTRICGIHKKRIRGR